MTAVQQKMEIDETALENAHQGAHLLIVDDDQPWLNRLGGHGKSRLCGAWRSFGQRRHQLGKSVKPAYAVVDMRLEDGNGLDVVESAAENPEARIIMLTGYGNIAPRGAVKRAVDYLAKPADADEIPRPGSQRWPASLAAGKSMSADRVRWEHIQRVLNYATVMYQKRRAG